MAKLKLSTFQDDRPVKLTIELPADVHRDLVAYAELLACQNGYQIEPRSSSHQCWRGSCRQIEHFYVRGEKRGTQTDRASAYWAPCD